MKVKGMTTTKATSSQEKRATLQQFLLECGKAAAPPGSSRRRRQAPRWRQPAQSMLYNLSKPETSTAARIILVADWRLPRQQKKTSCLLSYPTEMQGLTRMMENNGKHMYFGAGTPKGQTVAKSGVSNMVS